MARLKSEGRMSNRGYHRSGKPCWWVRIGKGNTAQFLTIERVRGDEYLDVELDIAPGTVVHIGCGRGRDGIRETITV